MSYILVSTFCDMAIRGMIVSNMALLSDLKLRNERMISYLGKMGDIFQITQNVLTKLYCIMNVTKMDNKKT